MVKDRQGASATRMKAQEDWKGAQKKPAEVRAQADTRAQVGYRIADTARQDRVLPLE